MSYEINKYAFLGCPLSDLVESISETDFPVIEDKMYLILDEKFEQIMAGLPQGIRSAKSCDVDAIVKNGPSEIDSREGDGPVSIVVATILSAAGVSDELLDESEIRSGLINGLSEDVFVLPTDTFDYKYKGDALSGKGAVEIGWNPAVQALLKGLASIGKITVLEGVTQDEDWNDVHNFKASMGKLLELRPRDKYDTGPEDLAKKLLNQFIKPRECFVEELGEWTWDVGVVSTRYGCTHWDGGMKPGKLYLVISGDAEWSCHDESGWDDPRETHPGMVEKMKEILFGEDSDFDFEVYTPEFAYV